MPADIARPVRLSTGLTRRRLMRRRRDAQAWRWRLLKSALAGGGLVALGIGVYFLLGFESPEQRAERLYQTGQAALEAGRLDEALPLFDQVIREEPRHLQAGLAMAFVLLQQGKSGEALALYLAVHERFPDDLTAVKAAATLQILQGDWPQAQAFGRKAQRIRSADPGVRAIRAALDLQVARAAGNAATAAAAVAAAEAVLAEDSAVILAHWVLAEAALSSQQPGNAVPPLKRAITLAPWSKTLEEMLRAAHLENGDRAAAKGQLRHMAARFPDDKQVQNLLLDDLTADGALEEGLALLRRIAGPAGANPDAELRIVAYAREHLGLEAAKDELRRLSRAAVGTALAGEYAAMVADIARDQGNLAEAVAVLDGLLAGAPPSDFTRALRIKQAGWEIEAGRSDAARQVVNAVLAEDPAQVDAIRLQAGWLIEAGRTEEALKLLRVSLTQDPHDSKAMLLMAAAYRKSGSVRLEGERLQAALESSQNGVEETLRLYDFLLRTGRIEVATSLLGQTLRLHPDDIGLLSAAASDAVLHFDWGRADDLIARIAAIGGEAAQQAAGSARRTRDQRQRLAETIEAQLQEAIGQAGSDLSLALRLVREQIGQGRLADALLTLENQQRIDPEQSVLILAEAAVLRLSGQVAAAEKLIRERLTLFPDDLPFLLALHDLYRTEGRDGEARALLDRAMAKPMPALKLRLLRGQELEEQGDFAQALALYRAAVADYRRDASAASAFVRLIAEHGERPDDLAQALALAPVLTEAGGAQDLGHLGWLHLRRGSFPEALALLHRAAEADRRDGLIQYRLGMALAATGQQDTAREALRQAAALALAQPGGLRARAEQALAGLMLAGPQ